MESRSDSLIWLWSRKNWDSLRQQPSKGAEGTSDWLTTGGVEAQVGCRAAVLERQLCFSCFFLISNKTVQKLQEIIFSSYCLSRIIQGGNTLNINIVHRKLFISTCRPSEMFQYVEKNTFMVDSYIYIIYIKIKPTCD